VFGKDKYGISGFRQEGVKCSGICLLVKHRESLIMVGWFVVI